MGDADCEADFEIFEINEFLKGKFIFSLNFTAYVISKERERHSIKRQ